MSNYFLNVFNNLPRRLLLIIELAAWLISSRIIHVNYISSRVATLRTLLEGGTGIHSKWRHGARHSAVALSLTCMKASLELPGQVKGHWASCWHVPPGTPWAGRYASIGRDHAVFSWETIVTKDCLGNTHWSHDHMFNWKNPNSVGWHGTILPP